jgi:predicted tellurium resistance membrane protein TerC
MTDLLHSFSELGTAENLINLLTLTLLEVVLGIDNIIFVSIIADRLPKEQQKKAWNIGMILAMALRIGLLFFLGFILQMDTALFTVFGHAMTGKDLILLGGGVFLLVKTTSEMHEKIEGGHDEQDSKNKRKPSVFGQVLLQITLVNIVFSFDSILTAVGISDNLAVMIIAVIISTIVMMIFSRPVADFVNEHPTVKMLALAFLLMIAMVLVLEAFHVEVPKPYVYCSILFAFLVELLNMRMRRKSSKKGAATREENKNKH